jgi:hypothetical protein
MRFKFSWQNFLLGALCGAIIIAVVWWRSTHVGEPYRISYEQAQDPETYDECLAAGNTTVACDAMMRLFARAKAREAATKQEGPWSAYKPLPDSRPPLESFVVKPDEASR